MFLSIFPCIDGKRKGESGTLTRATLECECTAVRLDNTSANIQAQAGCWTPTAISALPFAYGLPWPLGIRAIEGGESAEAGEECFLQFCCHARPSIDHLDSDAVQQGIIRLMHRFRNQRNGITFRGIAENV